MRLASAGLLAVFVLAACSRPEPAAEPVRAVRTTTAAPRTAAGAFEYAGEIRARTESRLSFRVGGKMVKRMVDLGESVKAGQLLAQLDARDLRLGQDAARASVAAATASYEQSAADWKRYKNLSEQGFIGPAELERREMALKTARAQLDQARAQSSVQGNQAGYAALVADASGVVTGIDLEPGMVASAGTPVLRLAHDGPRDVVFSVPEDRVAGLRAVVAAPGRLRVRLWGAPAGTTLPATLREVAAAADPATRTFLVKADLGAEPAAGLRLGQTATVLIDQPAVAGVIELPLSAFREAHGRTAVWLVDPATMTVRSQDVQLAGADGNDAVVAAGIKPGQVVVTAGVHVLSAGQKVKFWVDPGLAAASAPVATPIGIR